MTTTATVSDLKKPHVLIATWFGMGLIEPAPGTWGSFGALPFGLLIYGVMGPLGLAAAAALITIIGYESAKIFSERTGTEDSPQIVVDEVAGQWIALIGAGLNPVLIGLAFIFFRFFDITKLWPASRLEKIPGALGVMADDIAAGLYALLCLMVLRYAGLG